MSIPGKHTQKQFMVDDGAYSQLKSLSVQILLVCSSLIDYYCAAMVRYGNNTQQSDV